MWLKKLVLEFKEQGKKVRAKLKRGFIRAETIAFDDYMACSGEAGAKEAGKLRIEGSDYKVKDGDVFHFRFNV